MKWPLSFFYASVIPVILTSALIANVQLFGGLIQNWLGRPTFLGNIVNGQPVSGFLYSIHSTDIVGRIIHGSWEWSLLGQTLGHIVFYMFFAALFSVFWVKTSNMDAAAQANNILKSGLQIPGFRKDERVLERLLQRYIGPLTIMGAVTVGFLASLADLSGTPTNGTSLLLTVMIIYRLYEDVTRQHLMDMNPMLRKFMGG